MKTFLKEARQFVEDLHNHIQSKITFDKDIDRVEANVVKRQIVPVIREFLEIYFEKQGILEPKIKAEKCLNWEGREGGGICSPIKLFGAQQYPDVDISEPFKIAIEYKQNNSGALIKQCIGQSLIHWAVGEYDLIYYLFCDLSDGKIIKESLIPGTVENHLIEAMWYNHRTILKVV